MRWQPKIYSTFIEPLINIIIPPNCIFCNNTLENNNKIICDTCYKELKKASNETKQKLLKEINYAPIEQIFIGYEYSEKLKTLMHIYKYERFTTLAYYFASSISRLIQYPDKIDLIIPVPLHPSKQRERGYNQSELIVKHLSELLNIEYQTDILIRKKNTVSQTTLNKNERIQNVNDAFMCSKNAHNKTILIVDDVITTGSTLKACAECVFTNGAKNIQLAAVTTPPFSRNS